MNPDHRSDCTCDDCRVVDVDRERERMELWRLRELVEAGYAVKDAERIAADFSIDLHAACRLVMTHNCPPEIAARIVL